VLVSEILCCFTCIELFLVLELLCWQLCVFSAQLRDNSARKGEADVVVDLVVTITTGHFRNIGII
jgi:hypothetical protein